MATASRITRESGLGPCRFVFRTVEHELESLLSQPSLLLVSPEHASLLLSLSSQPSLLLLVSPEHASLLLSVSSQVSSSSSSTTVAEEPPQPSLTT